MDELHDFDSDDSLLNEVPEHMAQESDVFSGASYRMRFPQ